MVDPELRDARRAAGSAALALWAQGEGRKLGAELQAAGVRVMVLKGPELQTRLYGNPAVYPSSDFDVLVRPQDAGRARAAMRESGWSFELENGVLWRLSRAATFAKDGFRVDVHWGLHAAHLPGWSLRGLEAAMWGGASRGPAGLLEPDVESLLVFLAVHVVGHAFERLHWQENVKACAEQVGDWPKVWRIADRCRVRVAVETALRGDVPPGTRLPVIDGAVGRAEWVVSWVLRGHFLPIATRDRIRETVALAREGFGWAYVSRRTDRVGGLEFRVPRGVIRPSPWAEYLSRAWVGQGSEVECPVLVDVGTGCGVLAALAARARPDSLIFATDVSARAVAAARGNLKSAGLTNVRVLHGSLLSAMPSSARGRVTAVVANLPSVPPAGAAKLTWASPLRTIQGPDADGLGLMRTLLRQGPQYLQRGGSILMPLQVFQWQTLEKEALMLGYRTRELPPPKGDEWVLGVAEWPGRVGT